LLLVPSVHCCIVVFFSEISMIKTSIILYWCITQWICPSRTKPQRGRFCSKLPVLTISLTQHSLYWSPDPPENCHLNVKKNCQKLHFFSKKLPKISIYFWKNEIFWLFFLTFKWQFSVGSACHFTLLLFTGMPDLHPKVRLVPNVTNPQIRDFFWLDFSRFCLVESDQKTSHICSISG